jgi:hypothetical protein
VQNDLEVMDQLSTTLEEEYQLWLTYLNDEEDILYAHRWYEVQRHNIDIFSVGMNDWISIAKEHIEKQLEKSPSEQSTTTSRRSSTSAGRVKLAELRTQSIMLEKKQALRNEMERLEIEERIAIARAIEQVLNEEERRSVSQTRTDPCLPLHRKDDALSVAAKTLPLYSSSERKDNILMQSSIPLRARPTASFPDVHFSMPSIDVKREAQPAAPLRARPTPPSVKVSPISSSTATRIRTYSHPKTTGNEAKPETQPLIAMRTRTYSHPRPTGNEAKPETQSFLVHRHEEATSTATLATFLERQNRLTEILSEQNQRNLLPPLALSIFTNDPADYITFMSSFESQIESKVQSSEISLRYLEQFLRGEAKELIKGCQFKDPQLGYPEAKKLLKDKYGDPYQISNAYIKKITEWPVITVGNDQDLEHLSTFITQCVSAMESIAYLHILDHPHNLQNLLRKLPPYLQERWRRKVINIRETTDIRKIADFKSFADFLRIEAKIATDPVFSKQALAKN